MGDISPNFSTEEFTRSRTATKRRIDNSVPSTLMPNLEKLAYALERVRTLVNAPIVITSGYRSPALNTAVKGSTRSAHCHALAADIHTPAMDCRQLAMLIRASNIPFDQVIFEGSWVHFGLAKHGEEPRREVLSAVFEPGKRTRYISGIA